MHVAHEVAHGLQCAGRRCNDDGDPLTENIQFRVGDDDCHLNQGIRDGVQARHLAVDPDDGLTSYRHPTNVPGYRLTPVYVYNRSAASGQVNAKIERPRFLLAALSD
ncbi:hypothetical protein GCM10009784_19310 [Arthrobacter parietis]|uniref:Uncharacterized protein n=1 Tax=Arthrobacter parietis TaxID=271434 RepID=A0ABN3AXA2_9MICC